jgi:hypothetical protein
MRRRPMCVSVKHRKPNAVGNLALKSTLRLDRLLVMSISCLLFNRGAYTLMVLSGDLRLPQTTTRCRNDRDFYPGSLVFPGSIDLFRSSASLNTLHRYFNEVRFSRNIRATNRENSFASKIGISNMRRGRYISNQKVHLYQMYRIQLLFCVILKWRAEQTGA